MIKQIPWMSWKHQYVVFVLFCFQSSWHDGDDDEIRTFCCLALVTTKLCRSFPSCSCQIAARKLSSSWIFSRDSCSSFARLTSFGLLAQQLCAVAWRHRWAGGVSFAFSGFAYLSLWFYSFSYDAAVLLFVTTCNWAPTSTLLLFIFLTAQLQLLIGFQPLKSFSWTFPSFVLVYVLK